MEPEVLTYADLQREVLQALRLQYPEWVQPDGESPIYDRYEARLAELLGVAMPRRQGPLTLAEVPLQMTSRGEDHTNAGHGSSRGHSARTHGA